MTAMALGRKQKTVLKAPFPYFGGKSTVAAEVWRRFGDARNYVEPFCGSAAVLLERPQPFQGVETINDKDGFVCNFWRALQAEPDRVTHYADWPVNENDLHARHVWLGGQKESLQERLEGDPEWYDAKIAGWWAWGVSCWIGSGFCSGKGPWRVVDSEGVKRLVRIDGNGAGAYRKRPHLSNAGQGVHRSSVSGVLGSYLRLLADRLRRVRVCCGDWTRVLGSSVTTKHGLTAVFLDPPYSTSERDDRCYNHDDEGIAAQCRQWAIENGDNPLFRIALCGYDGEHQMPDNWSVFAWKTQGGYGNQGDNRARNNSCRERIWFSPHCLAAAIAA